MPANNKSVRGAVVFMLTAALLLLSQACSKSPQAHLEAGKKYMEEGKYSEALIEFRNATRKNSRFPEAHYQMGILYIQMGSFPDALREFQNTIGIDQNRLDAQLLVGNVLMMQRRYDEAREKAELVLDKAPDNIDAQILQANSWSGIININDSMMELRKLIEQEQQLRSPFISLGADGSQGRLDVDKAEELYRLIVDSNSRSVEARLALGNFYLLQRRNSEAESQYKAAVQSNPQSRDAVSALGFFYLQDRQFAEAEEQYKRYVELSKGDHDSQVILPDFYMSSGEIDRGIQTLERMAVDYPESSIFKRRLASIFFDRRELDKAVELSDELIKKDSGDAIAHFIKGRVLLIQNNGAEAVSHLRISARNSPRDAQIRYFLGMAHLMNREMSRAASELEFAIELNPAHTLALTALANLKLETGNVDEAIYLAQRVLSQNPGIDDARLILGSALATKKDYRAAAQELQAFAKNNPTNTLGMIQLGKLYMAQGNTAEAEARFEAALKNDPDNLSAATELARLYVIQNRHDRAIQRLNQILSQNPKLTRIHEILGQVYFSRNDYSSAEAEYKKAAEADPENAAQQIALAQFYQNSGQADRGIAVLQEFVGKNPTDITARLQLARVFTGNKDYDKAFATAGEVLKINDKDIDALLMRGQILIMQNKAAEAILALQDAVEASPSSQEARYFLGLAAHQAGDLRRAEQEWQSAADRGSQSVQIHLALSQLKIDAGEPDAAMRFAQQALNINPSSLDARRILGAALAHRRDYANAAAEFERYLQERPSDAVALQYLGQVQLELGNFAAAEARLNSALEADPKQTGALTALVGLYIRQNQHGKAIERVNREARRGLDGSSVHTLLGRIYLGQKENAKAEQEFQQAVSLDPKNPAPRQTLADFYVATGSTDKAEEILRKLVEEDPKDMDYRKRLISFHATQNNTDQALRLIDETLKTNPRDTEIRLMKASLLMSQDKLDESIRELQTAVENDRNSIQAYYMLGMAYLRDGKEAQAESALSSVIRIDPRYIRAYQALAQLKLGSGNVDAAIQYGRDALRADPNAVEMRLLLGESLMGRRYYREAISELEAYVNARPTDPRGFHRLGMAYLEQGNTARAEPLLQSALDQNPGNATMLTSLVRLDVERKQPDRAIARINAQIQKAPQNAELHELLGRVYLNQGNTARAEEAFRKQASIDGGRAAGSLNLAQLYQSRKSFDAAIAELQKVISENPKSGEAYTLLGMVYESLNDTKRAIESYRTALKNDPSQAITANNLAFLLAENDGDLKEAEQLAQQARKQFPDSTAVADTLAWVYYKRGAYRSAIDLLRDCVRQDPKNATYFYHLGMAYSGNGDSAQAKEALSQALNLNPNIPQASEIKSVLQRL